MTKKIAISALLILGAVFSTAGSCANTDGLVTQRKGESGNRSLLVKDHVDGSRTVWVSVTDTVYDRCPVGSLYPSCARNNR